MTEVSHKYCLLELAKLLEHIKRGFAAAPSPRPGTGWTRCISPAAPAWPTWRTAPPRPRPTPPSTPPAPSPRVHPGDAGAGRPPGMDALYFTVTAMLTASP